MKNYFVGLLVVIIIFLTSHIIKNNYENHKHPFAIPSNMMNETPPDVVPLYLFFFFSRKDCASCIVGYVNVLNELPTQYRIAGVVTDDKAEEDVKKMTGAIFPIYNWRSFQKDLPYRTPTLIAVSATGIVVMVLPVTKGMELYLKNIVGAIYGDWYNTLKMKKFNNKNRG